MVTIGMNYAVIPGKEQVFEDACAKVVETMTGIDGHEASSIYRAPQDGHHRLTRVRGRGFPWSHAGRSSPSLH